MGKHSKKYHSQSSPPPGVVRQVALQNAKRKHISFDANRNKVRFVSAPPRAMNDLFWFTEKQKVVKKGLQFELEPSISVEVTVDCKMQLTSIACPFSTAVAKEKPKGSAAVTRSFLEVREQLPFSEPGKWTCVGSVGSEALTKVRVIFPTGSYQLRCVGGPLVVFSQVWDIETQLH